MRSGATNADSIKVVSETQQPPLHINTAYYSQWLTHIKHKRYVERDVKRLQKRKADQIMDREKESPAKPSCGLQSCLIKSNLISSDQQLFI